jgi:heptosyltransferase-1
MRPCIAFIHGTTRADKLWPEHRWVELGRRAAGAGFRIALPSGSDEEDARGARLATAIGAVDAVVWPRMALGELVDRLAAVAGVIGVDSGPSHIAVALDLPHVQIYNLPTAWRTGPQARWGAPRQTAVTGEPAPDVDAVWDAWCDMLASAHGPGAPVSRT